MAKSGTEPNEVQGANPHSRGGRREPARQAVDRATLDAIVTLFLLRDGIVLPDELESESESVGKDAERQLLIYAELSGLLKAEVAQRATNRIFDADE